MIRCVHPGCNLLARPRMGNTGGRAPQYCHEHAQKKWANYRGNLHRGVRSHIRTEMDAWIDLRDQLTEMFAKWDARLKE